MTQKKVRILLAEDDSAETVDILASLFPDSTGGLDLTVVSTMATLIPTVRMVDPELILLDLELSLSIPLDAVHLVHRSAPGIPLVVLADPAALGSDLRVVRRFAHVAGRIRAGRGGSRATGCGPDSGSWLPAERHRGAVGTGAIRGPGR